MKGISPLSGFGVHIFSTRISFISVIPYCRQISVLFILWVIHICSDLRLHGFGGGGLGVYVSGCTGEGLGMKLKKMISLSLPFPPPPPLPLLNHDKNPRSSQKPIDSLLVLQKSPRKTTFINSDLYLLPLFSVLLTLPVERRVFSSQHSLQ